MPAKPEIEDAEHEPSEQQAKKQRTLPVKLAPLNGNVCELDKCFNFSLRRQMAILQRENMKVLSEDVQVTAKPGVDAFCQILRRRFGSIAAAWRLSLDPDRKGRLSFNEFVNVARGVGYCSNLKLLWNQLDSDESGFISLNELDPEAARILDAFRSLLIKKFGTTLKAWRHIDVDKNDRVDVHELEKRCQELGYKGNAKKLFHLLKTDVSRNFLTLADIDPEAFIARNRGDHNMLLAKSYTPLTQVRSAPSLVLPGPISPVSSSQSQSQLRPATSLGRSPGSPGRKNSGSSSPIGDASEWTKQQSRDMIQARKERKEKQEKADQGLKTVEGLRRLLLVRFGTYYGAWRQALDFDGNGRLSFGEFCLALRELGFMGNAKAAWSGLDRDKDGFIDLSDLDEQTAKEINAYRDLVKKKYGHMLGGWLNGLSKDGHTPVDEPTFIRHCEELGYPYDKSALFNNLKEDTSRKYMNLYDYDIPASNAFVRGDVNMVTEASGNNHSPRPLEMDFNERNEASFTVKWKREQSKARRENMKDIWDKERKADLAPSDFPSFKRVLLRKYGTITSAWKHALDPEGNGRLSFSDFCCALRRLGYCGNKKDLWIELDSSRTGLVTLESIDKQAHEYKVSLRKLMDEKYGSWTKLWHALDTNKNNRVDEEEFCEAMPKMGFELDSRQLFKYLLDRPGSAFLSLSDLDTSAASEAYRGLNVDKKKELEKLSVREKERLQGVSSLDALKKLLKRRYGTITSAWKHALDNDGNGRLSFVEFCQALQSVGYIGNIKAIFNLLDADKSGFISMDELDADAAAALAQFRELVRVKYGNFVDAWKAFDKDGNGSLDQAEFVARVKELGYEGNAKMLFKYYLDKPGCKSLQLSDLDPEAAREQYRDMNRDDTKIRRETIKMKAEAQRKSDKGMSDFNSLKALLIKKYGTIVAAWKHHLDKGRNNRISFVEFCNAMREIGFNSSLKTLWKELDADGSGFITLDEFDQEANRAMMEFRRLVLEKHGSFLAAWKVFDANGSNTLDAEEFAKECADLGYSGNPKKLFKHLLDKPGLKYLTLHDMDPEAAKELYRDPNRHDNKFKRTTLAQAADAAKQRDTGAKNLKGFKSMLKRKYGTITSAWQNALDMDGNGKLSFVEFSQAVRALAYAGNVKDLWNELDTDGSGLITLDELEPKVHRVIAEFKTFVLGQFANYKDAWRSLDASKKMMVSEEDFNAWCAGLGFEVKPELFKNLLDKPGARFLKEDFFNGPHFAD